VSAATQSGAAGSTVQAQSILSQVGTTAGTLPDAVAGLRKTPDDSIKAKSQALNATLSGAIGKLSGTPNASPTPRGLRARTCRRPPGLGERAQSEPLWTRPPSPLMAD